MIGMGRVALAVGVLLALGGCGTSSGTDPATQAQMDKWAAAHAEANKAREKRESDAVAAKVKETDWVGASRGLRVEGFTTMAELMAHDEKTTSMATADPLVETKYCDADMTRAISVAAAQRYGWESPEHKMAERADEVCQELQTAIGKYKSPYKKSGIYSRDMYGYSYVKGCDLDAFYQDRESVRHYNSAYAEPFYYRQSSYGKAFVTRCNAAISAADELIRSHVKTKYAKASDTK